jgi:hypothetical protein
MVSYLAGSTCGHPSAIAVPPQNRAMAAITTTNHIDTERRFTTRLLRWSGGPGPQSNRGCPARSRPENRPERNGSPPPCETMSPSDHRDTDRVLAVVSDLKRATKTLEILHEGGGHAVVGDAVAVEAALHMSAFGTSRTWRDVRLESALCAKADMARMTTAGRASPFPTWQSARWANTAGTTPAGSGLKSRRLDAGRGCADQARRLVGTPGTSRSAKGSRPLWQRLWSGKTTTRARRPGAHSRSRQFSARRESLCAWLRRA